MAKVDRSILAANDQSMGQFGDPDKLESSISHLADTIDSNDTDISILKTDNTSNKGRLNTLEGDVSTLKTDNTSNKSRITENENDIAYIDARVTDLLRSNPQPSEVVDARLGFPVLRDKLESIDSQLAETELQLESQWLNVKYPFVSGLTPLKGDGSNEQDAFLAIINYAKDHLPMKLIFPKGTYGYSDLGNIAYEGLTLEGLSEKSVIFKCLNTVADHIALDINGFRNNTEMDQFVKHCNLKNIVVEGNSLTAKILRLKGIVLSNFQDVVLREGNTSNGRALSLESCMSNTFIRVVSSITTDPTMVNKPYYGLYMEYGYRGTTTPGSCTNNTFMNCYFDGMIKGGYLDKADQNIFIACAFQKNSNRGLEITNGNRWNTLINTAFESNTNDDIYDNGRSTQFINIYAINKIILDGQLTKVQGGEFGVVQNNGINNVFENIRVNFKRNGLGAGFIDNGIATSWKNIYDLDSSVNKYIYPNKPRTSISVGSSPFTWQNTTGKYVQVFMQTGTVSQVYKSRNGDSNVLLPNTAPNSFIIPPEDSITFTYSAAPGLSYTILNGF